MPTPTDDARDSPPNDLDALAAAWLAELLDRGERASGTIPAPIEDRRPATVAPATPRTTR